MVKKTMKLQIVELKKPKGGWKVNCETHGIQKLIPIPNPTPREIGGVICEKCAELRKPNLMKHTNQKKIENRKSVMKFIFKNKAEIEISVYPKPLKGEDISDRIHLMIWPEGQKPRGWIFNAFEANDIIRGLSEAIMYIYEHDLPTIANLK